MHYSGRNEECIFTRAMFYDIAWVRVRNKKNNINIFSEDSFGKATTKCQNKQKQANAFVQSVEMHFLIRLVSVEC